MKICTKCGEDKPYSEYYNNKDNKTTGKQPKCKKCMNDEHAEWVENNRENLNKRQRDYVDKNRELIQKRGREKFHRMKKDKVWYENYLRVGRINARKHMHKILKKQNKRTADLDDYYLKLQIIKGTNLKIKNIPNELVELKRTQLQLHRELRK